MDVPPLTIGLVARGAGVSVETVRYYQRRRLLPVPPKPAGGFRHYPLETIRQLRFIKRAQDLGLSLAEVRRLMTLDGARDCRKTRQLAAEKLALVDAKLTELRRLRRALSTMIGECDASDRTACPIIERLRSDATL